MDKPARSAHKTVPPSDATPDLAIEIARLLRDDKCEDVLVLDLRGRSQITDFFVIATGTSQRQMRSVGQHVEAMASDQKAHVFRSNLSDRDSSWYVIDISGVIVHLFESHTRSYYDLEMLWGDADRVEWRRADQRDGEPAFDPGRNRAGLRAADLPAPTTADDDDDDTGA